MASQHNQACFKLQHHATVNSGHRLLRADHSYLCYVTIHPEAT